MKTTREQLLRLVPRAIKLYKEGLSGKRKPSSVQVMIAKNVIEFALKDGGDGKGYEERLKEVT